MSASNRKRGYLGSTPEGGIDDADRPLSEEPIDPYFIEIDENGCSKCGGGRTWTVVGPDDTRLGQSWGDEEDAISMAEELNTAYARGVASNMSDELNIAYARGAAKQNAAPQAGSVLPTFVRPGSRFSPAVAATHRCRLCGCLWRQGDSGLWSLAGPKERPRVCCDNSPEFLSNLEKLIIMPPVDSALSTDSPGTQAGTDGAEPSTSALSTGSFRPRVLDESAHKLAREIAKDKKKSTEALIAIGAIDPHDVAVASALDELRRACANIIKADPKTWPYHHHAPLIPIAINAAKQAPAGNIGISAKLHRPKASAVAGPQVVTAEMEEAGRKYARENDPSTFAGIFEAMRAVAPQTSPPNIGPAVKVLKQYAEQIKSTHIGDDGTWGEEASAKKWYDEVIRAIAMLEQPGAVARLTALNTMARKLLGVVGSQPKATQLLVTKRLLVDAANEINTLAAWVENHDSETQNTRRAEKALRALLDAMEYAPPNSGCSGYVFIPKAIIEQAREALDVPPESAA